MLLPDTMELRICVPYNSRSTAWASFDGRGRVELKRELFCFGDSYSPLNYFLIQREITSRSLLLNTPSQPFAPISNLPIGSMLFLGP